MEPKKHKEKIRYTIMLVSDSAKGGIRSMSLDSRIVTSVTALLVIVLIVGSCFIAYDSSSLKRVQAKNNLLEKKVEELTDKNSTLTTQNTELSDKVAILSETINQKVKTEEAQAAEEEEKKVPTGFPLAGPATILESSEIEPVREEAEAGENEEAREEGQPETGEAEAEREKDPIVVFSAPVGTIVIATASGTVFSIEEDAKYGNIMVIDHGNGYASVYRTQSPPMAKKGDEVQQGQPLFEMQSQDSRLGYQIMKDDKFIDPLELMEIYG